MCTGIVSRRAATLWKLYLVLLTRLRDDNWKCQRLTIGMLILTVMVLFCIQFSLGADCFGASEVASSGILSKSTHNGDCNVPQGVYNFDDLVIQGGIGIMV